jgi:PIN domain nuclease of toxin-antitoxin system
MRACRRPEAPWPAIARVARLPTHHRDPFDRHIIAQSLVAGHAIMTSDVRFAGYGVSVIW